MPSLFTNALAWALSNERLLLYAAGIIAISYVIKYITVGYLKAVAKKTANDLDNLATDVVQAIGWWFLLALALFIVTRGVEAPFGILFDVFFILMATRQVTLIVHALFFFARRELVSRGGRPIIRGFKSIIDIIVWSLGILAVFASFGFDVTTFVAGLGIGGVAIALALKDLLSDVLSSLSIYFDKPFTVGDYIQRGSYEGVVEEIGLKTTRLRSPQGEQLILSNSELTSSGVQNFGRLKTRRITDVLSLPFETSRETLLRFESEIKTFFQSLDHAEFCRLHVAAVESSALKLELVYFADSKHYDSYKDVEHQVNLGLRDALVACELTLA